VNQPLTAEDAEDAEEKQERQLNRQDAKYAKKSITEPQMNTAGNQEPSATESTENLTSGETTRPGNSRPLYFRIAGIS
jgi:hypothetical protein